MIEAGVVIADALQPVFWHLPAGRTGGALPDDRNLWDVMWDLFQKHRLIGFAHSHPGSGVPGPSYTDVTTFAAIEAALGKRIWWWITSDTHMVELKWAGPDKLSYRATVVTEEPPWAAELRRLSKPGEGR